MQQLEHKINLIKKEYFGCSIAICEKGHKFVIGARGGSPTDPVTNGTAYVFENDKITKLEAPDGKLGDRFGVCCKISHDGSIIVIGAYQANSVYVLKNEKFLYKISEDAKHFGYNLDINSDGTKIVVGAFNYNNDQGKVFYYENGDLIDEFQADDTKEGDFFGRTVKLSDDENQLMIGTRNHEKVYRFDYQSIWIEKEIITNMYNPRKENIKERHGRKVFGSFLKHDNWFGYSIDIFPDGRSLVGAPRENGHGEVYLCSANFSVAR